MGMYSAREYIKSDCFRYKGKCDFSTRLKFYLKDSTFRWQVAFRMVNGSGIVKLIGKVLFHFNRSRRYIQIERTTKIGYGLFIGHGGPVVINKTAVLGNNVNLSQFVTIGTNKNQAATIGDNVYIGPNVCIVEDVSIGDNTTIGAGSVVTKNVPENSTVAGNYAKVLHYKNVGAYVNNRWAVKEKEEPQVIPMPEPVLQMHS